MNWLGRLSPIPSFPPYAGPYQVGTIDVELPSSDLAPSSPSAPPDAAPTVAFRIFYPCSPPTHATRPVRWIPQPQKTVVASLAKFLGTNDRLANLFAHLAPFLNYISIPAHRNAPLCTCPHTNKRWPVMVFSHGLAGSRNTYSHLCGSIASHGMVVIAMDHRDGSSPVQHLRATNDTKEEVRGPKRYAHTHTKDVFDGRDEQLRIRMWELALMYRAVLDMDAGKQLDNLDLNNSASKKERVDVLGIFKGSLDLQTPGKVAWAGHSFGAATMVQFVKSVYYANDAPAKAKPLYVPAKESPLSMQITSSSPLALFDLWGLPLASTDQAWLEERRLPCYTTSSLGGAAVLSVLSEAFHNWRGNLDQVKTALSPPEAYTGSPPSIFYPTKSQHFSQSDFGILFPWLTERFMSASEPERVLNLNLRATLQMLRNAGVSIAATNLTATDTSALHAAHSHKSAQNVEDDLEILAVPSTIRGWVPVDLGKNVDGDAAMNGSKADADGEVDHNPSLAPQENQGGAQVVKDADGNVA